MAKLIGFETASMTLHREVFIEYSIRYIVDDIARKMGIARVPLASSPQPSKTIRLIRKAFRLTILPIMTGLASLAGGGESIHAVFKKKIT